MPQIIGTAQIVEMPETKPIVIEPLPSGHPEKRPIVISPTPSLQIAQMGYYQQPKKLFVSPVQSPLIDPQNIKKENDPIVITPSNSTDNMPQSLKSIAQSYNPLNHQNQQFMYDLPASQASPPNGPVPQQTVVRIPLNHVNQAVPTSMMHSILRPQQAVTQHMTQQLTLSSQQQPGSTNSQVTQVLYQVGYQLTP